MTDDEKTAAAIAEMAQGPKTPEEKKRWESVGHIAAEAKKRAVAMGSKARNPVMLPGERPCPCPTLKPGTTEVDTVCGELSPEMLCPKHWARVSRETRRLFVAERDRLRKVRSPNLTERMKKLIAMAITEAATGAAA